MHPPQRCLRHCGVCNLAQKNSKISHPAYKNDISTPYWMKCSCWLYAYHNRLRAVLVITTAISLGFDVTFIVSRSTARVLTFGQVSPIYCFGKSFVSLAQELPKSTPNRPLKEYRACPNLSLHLYQNRLKHFHLYPTPLHLPSLLFIQICDIRIL